MPIIRDILRELRTLLKEYPIVTILGPRQAGKTTLAKEFLDGFAYANLEDPEQRELATADPKAFLSTLGSPAIIDEIQRIPELLTTAQARYLSVASQGSSRRYQNEIQNLFRFSVPQLSVFGSFQLTIPA